MVKVEIFDNILFTEHRIAVLKDIVRTGARGHRGAAYQLKNLQAELLVQLDSLTDAQLGCFMAYRKANR